MKMLLPVVACFSLVQAWAQTLTLNEIPLGGTCDPRIADICAGGASCYSTNSMLIPRCGNFQANCSSNAQCAFNTCNAGFCNGLKPSATPFDPSTPVPTSTSSSCDAIVSNRCEPNSPFLTSTESMSSIPIIVSNSSSSFHLLSNSATPNSSTMVEISSAVATSTFSITQSTTTTTSFQSISYATSIVIVSGHTSPVISSPADPVTYTSITGLANSGSGNRFLAHKQSGLFAVFVAWVIV